MPEEPRDAASSVSRIAVLDQPIRRDLYRLLASTDEWIDRDHAADALDLPRSVAAFHLDKLADAGVVEVRFERTSGRRGPGAGRPSKLYHRSQDELSASVPDRSYDLAGLMLAEALNESAQTGAPAQECLRAVAHATGRQLGAEAVATAGGDGAAAADAPDVADVLAAHGYEPHHAGHDLVLQNCPFHRLADAQRPLVCGMNRDFLEGVLDGMGRSSALDARLDPQPGFCCVRITGTT